MKKVLMILAIFLVACSAPQVVVESPGQVTEPEIITETPAAPPVTTPVTPETPPVVLTGDCQKDCENACYPNANKVCNPKASYTKCVPICGDLLRPTGCKGVCATESDKECTLVFESECRRDCRDKCPATE